MKSVVSCRRSLSIAATMIVMLTLVSVSHSEDWRGFRGTAGKGVANSESSVPTRFSDAENVRWKVELPGAGASSPIIVGDRVIVTCYSGYGQSRQDIGQIDDLRRHVVCFSKSDGSKLWQKDLEPVMPEDPFSGMGVPEHGYSSSTPVSDGQHVYVFFGKSGVIGYDLDGTELWRTSVGTASGDKHWGSGASLTLAGDILVVNATDESDSIIGLNKDTGEEVWKNPGIKNIWSTPVVMGSGEDADVVVSVPYEVWGLNPANGKLKWFTTNGVQDGSVSSSPMVNGDVVVAMGGRSNTAVAVRRGGDGDVTDSHTVWTGKSIGRISTPVLYDGHIYAITRGIATCLDASNGKEVYKQRVDIGGDAPQSRGPSGNYNSPIVADGKLIQFTKAGKCIVMAAKPEFELLAVNDFAEDGSEFNSTPAISGNEMFVRSNRFLYCIAGSDAK